VSVTEPSDAVNAGMAIQTEGSRLALRASGRPQLDLWLVGWSLSHFIDLPMKMEPTESSETSAFSTRTPGKYPKENALQNLFYLAKCLFPLTVTISN